MSTTMKQALISSAAAFLIAGGVTIGVGWYLTAAAPLARNAMVRRDTRTRKTNAWLKLLVPLGETRCELQEEGDACA